MGRRGKGVSASSRVALAAGAVLALVVLTLIALLQTDSGESPSVVDEPLAIEPQLLKPADTGPPHALVIQPPGDPLPVDGHAPIDSASSIDSAATLTVVLELVDEPGVAHPPLAFRVAAEALSEASLPPRDVPLEPRAGLPASLGATLMGLIPGEARWWLTTSGLIVACGRLDVDEPIESLLLHEADLPFISGRVLGPTGGHAGATVDLTGLAADFAHRGLTAQAHSAPDGRFTFRGVPRDALYDIRVQADGFTTIRRSAWGFEAGAERRLDDLVLERRHGVTVEVSRPGGEFADDAVVVLAPASGEGSSSVARGARVTLTDVPPGEWVLQAWEGSNVSEAHALIVGADGSQGPWSLRLAEGAFVTGVVEGSDGTALPGLHVRARSGAFEHAGVTDAEGRFALGPFTSGASAVLSLQELPSRTATAGGAAVRMVVDQRAELIAELLVTDASSGERLDDELRWTLRSDGLSVSGLAQRDEAGRRWLRHRGTSWVEAELRLETDTHSGGIARLDEAALRGGLLEVALSRREASYVSLVGPDGAALDTGYARLSWPADGPRSSVPGAGWDVLPLDGQPAFVLAVPVSPDGRLRLEVIGRRRRLSLLSPGCLPVTLWLEAGDPLPRTVQLDASDLCGSGPYR